MTRENRYNTRFTTLLIVYFIFAFTIGEFSFFRSLPLWMPGVLLLPAAIILFQTKEGKDYKKELRSLSIFTVFGIIAGLLIKLYMFLWSPPDGLDTSHFSYGMIGMICFFSILAFTLWPAFSIQKILNKRKEVD